MKKNPLKDGVLMISGILRPNAGKVTVKGADIWTLNKDQLADFR
jgi:putative ABC transport system ATP-binding protein